MIVEVFEKFYKILAKTICSLKGWNLWTSFWISHCHEGSRKSTQTPLMSSLFTVGLRKRRFLENLLNLDRFFSQSEVPLKFGYNHTDVIVFAASPLTVRQPVSKFKFCRLCLGLISQWNSQFSIVNLELICPDNSANIKQPLFQGRVSTVCKSVKKNRKKYLKKWSWAQCWPCLARSNLTRPSKTDDPDK